MARPLRAMLSALVAQTASAGVLDLQGTNADSHILMNGAKLVASCTGPTAAVTDFAISGLDSLIIDGFSPEDTPGEIIARFINVAPTCVGVPVRHPCVAPVGDSRPPLFSCRFTGLSGSLKTTKLRATWSNTVQAQGGAVLAYEILLKCPLPTFEEMKRLTSYAGDKEDTSLTVEVYFFDEDTSIPYEGIPGRDVLHYTNLPYNSPPPPPPYNPPSPPLPPPPLVPYGPGNPASSCEAALALGQLTSGPKYIAGFDDMVYCDQKTLGGGWQKVNPFPDMSWRFQSGGAIVDVDTSFDQASSNWIRIQGTVSGQGNAICSNAPIVKADEYYFKYQLIQDTGDAGNPAGGISFRESSSNGHYTARPSAMKGYNARGSRSQPDSMTTASSKNKAIFYASRSKNTVKWWSSAEGKFVNFEDNAVSGLLNVAPDTNAARAESSFNDPNADLFYYAWQWTDYGAVAIWQIEAFARGFY